MKILQYRTIAEVYPYLSLEAKVEMDNGEIIYPNISVNDQGNKEVYDENRDDKWIYTVPLNRVDWMHPEKYYYGLTLEEEYYVFNQLIEFWNQNPVFIGDGIWKPFPVKIMKKADEKKNGLTTLSELFSNVSDEEMLEIYKDIAVNKELGIAVNSLKSYAKEINFFETMDTAMKVVEVQFYKEMTKRYFKKMLNS